ncbi:MAG: GGDEF domain-containing protein [Clostridia bacterium]|nr:GGDEF domain-containing protein [Clostridia bacterium]
MAVAIVVILVIIVIGLIIYNLNIHKKIQTFNNINQRINNLSIVQDFMSIVGERISVDQKIQKMNDTLIEKYEIKYSTIVVFDGAEYTIKASNVDRKHWNSLKALQNVDMFKDSIATATPKYVTVNEEGERLPYQQVEFGRAKSAIFFPLYIDNVYIGYWIIESGTPHDFDNVDITILDVVKDNMVSVLKNVVHQKTLEALDRIDKFTGLDSEAYLYGDGKKVIDKYTMSTVCMFKITNLEDINKKCSRELGNKVLTEVSNYFKQNLTNEYIIVRYMGPKFAIVFSGVELNGVVEFLNDNKEEIEKLQISLEKIEENPEENKTAKKGRKKKQVIVSPRLNFAVSTYYKGTGLEEVLKKLENYLDSAPAGENDINNI